MAVTLRGDTQSGKGSPLTNQELDDNFSIIGLQHGDTVADLDVSSIIINASNLGSRPMVVKGTSDSVNSVAKFTRESGSVGPKTAIVAEAEFTINAATGMGTGIWTQINAADTDDIFIGGIQGELKSWTDSNTYTSEFGLYTYDNNSGTGSLNKVIAGSTQRVELQAPLKVAHYTNTEIISLAAHTGSIIFNTTENEFQGWNGTSWAVLG